MTLMKNHEKLIVRLDTMKKKKRIWVACDRNPLSKPVRFKAARLRLLLCQCSTSLRLLHLSRRTILPSRIRDNMLLLFNTQRQNNSINNSNRHRLMIILTKLSLPTQQRPHRRHSQPHSLRCQCQCQCRNHPSTPHITTFKNTSVQKKTL